MLPLCTISEKTPGNTSAEPLKEVFTWVGFKPLSSVIYDITFGFFVLC